MLRNKSSILANPLFLTPCLFLLALSLRLPYLLNAETMNSDHAFLGLQGLRLFHGEWELFLWGSQYQISWEPLIASFLFLFFPKSFFTLQWVPLLAFMLCFFIVVRLLSREFKWTTVLILLLPWVSVGQPIAHVNVLPYRQWSIFFSLLPISLVHETRAQAWRWRIAGFLPWFALMVDFFSIEFSVPIFIYLLVRAKEEKTLKEVAQGFFCGILALLATRIFATSGAPLAFSLARIPSNAKLLFQNCLPTLFGVQNPPTRANLGETLGLVVGFILITLQIFAGAVAFFSVRAKNSVRQLSFFGSLTVLSSLVGFMGSSMASDVFSARYLQPIIYSIPFALGVFMASENSVVRRCTATFLVLYSIFVGYAGWNQSAPFSQGFKIIRDPHRHVETSKKMGQWIQSQKVTAGFSDYWEAYRLSFLYLENPLIVPRNVPDRYRRYRQYVLSQEKVAEIFTPSSSAKEISEMENKLRSSLQFISKWQENGFTVFIRKAGP